MWKRYRIIKGSFCSLENMKIFSFIIILFFSVSKLQSQNLVTNPGFESMSNTHINCNLCLSYEEFNASNIGWFSPINSTPDIYSLSISSLCYNSPLLVGNRYSIYGKQMPHSGQNFTGLIPSAEYISNMLRSSLIIGKRYKLCFYTSLGDNCRDGDNNLGMFFSTVDKSNYNSNFRHNPLFEYKNVVTDDTGWTKIEHYFVADSAYQYITIGNFRDFSDNDYMPNMAPNSDAHTTKSYTLPYYFIDDVTVEPACLEVSPDTFVCVGSNIELVAKSEGFIGWALSSKPDVLVSTDAIYTVSPTARTSYMAYSACDTNEVTVRMAAPFSFDLGKDREGCKGDTFMLNAFANNCTYLWQDETTNARLYASKTGKYRVTATIGCYSYTDSVFVNIKPMPTVDLGKDTVICIGENYLLNVYNPGATYLWQDGSKDSVFAVRQYAPNFNVKVTLNGCSKSDQVSVRVFDRPKFSLGHDTSICSGKKLLLNARAANYASALNYLWQDGSVKNSYEVSKEGTYHVKLYPPQIPRCSNIDTINVIYKQVGNINFGPDTSLCANETLLLDATVAAPATYKWNTTTTSPTYQVNKAGFYKVTVSKNGCSVSDSITVSYYPQLNVDLGKDRGIYANESILLDAKNTNASYHWQDGSTEPQYKVTEEGKYWVTIKAGNHCLATDTVNIIVIALEMPNVFTPNDDHANDYFVPMVMKGVIAAQLNIYNRWGHQVFKTDDLKQGWDGNNTAEGVYYWDIKYTDVNGKFTALKGDVTLIR